MMALLLIILGIVVGVGLAMAVSYLWCSFFPPKEKHKHNWRCGGVDRLKRCPTTSFGIPLVSFDKGAPVTVTLWRCMDCDMLFTKEIDGWWTFEQVSGQVGSGETISETPEVAGSEDAGKCPDCSHKTHLGVSCLESDCCGCGQ
jgi:hypothetical protein